MKNPGEIVHAQGIERGDYGQPPDDLGNQPEPFEVFRLHLSKQPISRHLAVFRHLTEAEAAPPETHGDDLFQTYERPAADEQDVGRVEGDAGLLRVLVAAKRWHSGDRAFEKLQEGVLNAQTQILSGSPTRLPSVDLVDVDDAPLSGFQVSTGSLDQL